MINKFASGLFGRGQLVLFTGLGRGLLAVFSFIRGLTERIGRLLSRQDVRLIRKVQQFQETGKKRQGSAVVL